jgi:hypothetical protein
MGGAGIRRRRLRDRFKFALGKLPGNTLHKKSRRRKCVDVKHAQDRVN